MVNFHLCVCEYHSRVNFKNWWRTQLFSVNQAPRRVCWGEERSEKWNDGGRQHSGWGVTVFIPGDVCSITFSTFWKEKDWNIRIVLTETIERACEFTGAWDRHTSPASVALADTGVRRSWTLTALHTDFVLDVALCVFQDCPTSNVT